MLAALTAVAVMVAAVEATVVEALTGASSPLLPVSHIPFIYLSCARRPIRLLFRSLTDSVSPWVSFSLSSFLCLLSLLERLDAPSCYAGRCLVNFVRYCL